VLNDSFGNGVATVSGGVVVWSSTRVGGYGPLPDNQAEVLADPARVAEATAWRSRRIDPTGFYYLGARYYEPTSGRFLSPDPLGHGSDMSLYAFANGDPVNGFDPDGRMATTFKNNSLNYRASAYINRPPYPFELWGSGQYNRALGDFFGGIASDNWNSIKEMFNFRDNPYAATANVIMLSTMFSRGGGGGGGGRLQVVGELPRNLINVTPRNLSLPVRAPIAGELSLPTSMAVATPGSFSVVDWTGYPPNLPKPAGPMNLLPTGSDELLAAQRAKAVINNDLREAFGLRGVDMDIHEIQPVKFNGSPTDLSNKLLIPRDLHQQVVTPFWNQLQKDIAHNVYNPSGT
jgi:RHS repeat-associated protein